LLFGPTLVDVSQIMNKTVSPTGFQSDQSDHSSPEIVQIESDFNFSSEQNKSFINLMDAQDPNNEFMFCLRESSSNSSPYGSSYDGSVASNSVPTMEISQQSPGNSNSSSDCSNRSRDIAQANVPNILDEAYEPRDNQNRRGNGRGNKRGYAKNKSSTSQSPRVETQYLEQNMVLYPQTISTEMYLYPNGMQQLETLINDGGQISSDITPSLFPSSHSFDETVIINFNETEPMREQPCN
jgi:hypothetical protein